MDVELADPHRITLRFPRVLEREYQQYFIARNLVYARAAFMSGIALYALFAHLDYVLAPSDFQALWLIRLGITMPLLVAFLAFTFTRAFRRLMQPSLAFICAGVALSVDAINVSAFHHTGNAYYFGVIIVNMYLHTFGRVQWSWAAPVGIINVLAYEASLLFVGDVSYRLLVTSNYFIFSTLALGMVACYTMEHMSRREFLRTRQLSSSNAELQESSSTDSLTGLLNRRSILRRLDEEAGRNARNGRTFSIAIVDADHFKKINDRWGHLCGDEALKRLALLMKSTLRAGDLAARWGGEEFLIVFPDTRLAGARIVAEQLRRRVHTLHLQRDGKPVPFTITIGVAEVATGEDPSDALRRADNALYEGKHLGRDRTVIAAPTVIENVPQSAAPVSEHHPGRETEQ